MSREASRQGIDAADVSKIFDWFRNPPAPAAEPLSNDSTSFLWKQSAHFRRLPGPLRTAFGDDVQRFIARQRITGIKTEVNDRLRLLVGASAATLSVGWRGYTWSEVSEVLLYPDDFDGDYTIGRREISGVAHVWGTVILSVPSLWRSFSHDETAYHVGYHEFAHLLTYERGLPIRVPVGLPATRIKVWETIQRHELKRIDAGDSLLDPYASNPSEFFPCAVEAFFQNPIALRETHRRLYGFLSRYFGQNPAVWESNLRRADGL
jgi:MtfA peptidase